MKLCNSLLAGVEDIETTNAGDHKRKKIIASSKDERLDVVAKSLGIKSGVEGIVRTSTNERF